MKLKCLSGKHGDGSGWYENEPLGFRVERELHFFNLTVARHHRIELYSTDSPALPFKRHTDAATQPPPPICSASAGEKLNICRRQLQEGFQKLPKLQIYTSLPCACKGSVWTQAIQIHTSAVCYILLRLRWNEDCFPKRQTSFVISSSFFLPMCQKFQTFLQNGVPGLEECHVIIDPTLDRPIMGLSYLSAQGWEGETWHYLKGDSLT